MHTTLIQCLLVLTVITVLTGCASVKKIAAGRGVLCAEDWVSYDGKTMPWKSWPVPTGVTPRGVVITIHGLSGAKSDFWYLGEQLPLRGYAVYAYDLRGQGNDPVVAERGDISKASAWQRDLATFCNGRFHLRLRLKYAQIIHTRERISWAGLQPVASPKKAWQTSAGSCAPPA
jgi:predicted alpha/beta-fold hydrolase